MGTVSLQGRDARGIVRVVFNGLVTAEDIEEYLLYQSARGLFAIPTIIDSRSAIYVLSPTEARSVRTLVVELRQKHGYGFTAQVADVDVTFGILRMHALSTESSDPGFAVFRTMEEAERWMHERIEVGAMPGFHAHE